MGTTRSTKSERQRYVRVSTLVEFVRAQGGELEITAVFDGTRISLLRPDDSAQDAGAPSVGVPHVI